MRHTVWGIDLGTTNSCLAAVRDGAPQVVEIDGQLLVPSVVSLDDDSGEILVGVRARNRAALYPELTVASVKRRMGSPEPVQLGQRAMSPEEVSAEILRYLARRGEAALGEPVRQVVITVPAFFDDAQRRATIRAGELAGLEVLRILNEPTAAALVYRRAHVRGVDAVAGRTADGATPGDDHNVLVYDLGGGTFDVSVLRLDGELYRVGASYGDTQLGGDDFDRALVALLLERSGHPELARDRLAAARLKDAAERAKVELSGAPFATVMEEALAPSVDLRDELSRRDFEELLEPFLERTLSAVDQALETAEMTPETLDRVLLVGGSTRIPLVGARLAARLGRAAEHAVDPDLCVAMGAAVQGAILAGVEHDRILVDVAAHSLGIKTADRVTSGSRWLAPGNADHFAAIIPRNCQVPTTRAEVFYTVVDDQKVVEVEVFQGEHERCSDNALIGQFTFELEPAPADSEVEVELGYDLDGVVHVVITQRGAGNRREVTLATRRQPAATPPAVAAAGPGGVDNFILRKARDLASATPAGELRDRLTLAAAAYATALADDTAGEGAVDEAEDVLLAVLEEATDGA